MNPFATCINNIQTTLAQNRNSGDNLVVVGIPSITLATNEWVRVTLLRLSDNAICIFRCTSITGNTFSSLTPIEGTSDISALVGDKVEMRITAGHLIDAYDNLEYTSTTPTNITVGGVPAGSNFTNVLLAEVVDQILHAYLTPAFTAFSIVGAATQEVGEAFSGTKTFDWSTSNNTNIQSDSISISDGSTSYGSNLANTGSTTAAVNVTHNVPATHTWTISATNTNSSTFSATTSIAWLFRVFFGASASTTLDATAIQALASNQLANGFGGDYGMAAGNYKYLTYPDSFGGINNIIDTSTGFGVAMAINTDNAFYSNLENGFYYGLVSVTNAFAITTNYRVYRTRNTLSSAITLGVN